MLTPQDLKGKEFATALLGGYDMSSVDNFLEKVAADYTALFKENAVLKGKLKLLVEKVEEYRSTEDAMRMALLTAQKMAKEIEDEAQKKADDLLQKCSEDARQREAALQEKLTQEEARLTTAEQKTSEFSRKMLKLLAEEKQFIEQLEELIVDEAPMSPPAPSVSTTSAEPPAAAPSAAGQAPPASFAPATADSDPAPPIAVEEIHSAEPAESISGKVTTVPDATTEASAPAAPGEEDKVDAFFELFDQDRIEEAFSKAQESASGKPIPPAGDPAAPNADTAREAEKIDIAREISASLGDTSELKINPEQFLDDEGLPTTKRPKFEFDDLQFGENLKKGD